VLVAYVIPGDRFAPEAVRGELERLLPSFMVPHAIVSLGELPLNSHGKVDRRALARRPLDALAVEPGSVPRTWLERLLAALWCEVLEIDAVGRHDSFFDLGGDSLQAMRLATRARERGIRLGAEDLFDHEVLHELADAIGRTTAGEG
jgi:aryl carrier-like protein